jgi:hypothetical protein
LADGKIETIPLGIARINSGNEMITSGSFSKDLLPAAKRNKKKPAKKLPKGKSRGKKAVKRTGYKGY